MTHKRYRNPDPSYSRSKERENTRNRIDRDLFAPSAASSEPATSSTAATQSPAETLADLDLGALVGDGPKPEPKPTRQAEPTQQHPTSELPPIEKRKVTRVVRGGVDPAAEQEVHKPTVAQRMIDRLFSLLRRSR
ncbi:MAG: hypothetical protein IPM29_07585 [Planctomycetes bacterium]|nr:hypothetical protein [Planctomycetota bacterium]